MINFNIKTILVPVDFSPASINALNSAVVLAKKFDAAIILVHVAETTGLSDGTQMNGPTAEENLMAITFHAEQKLQTLQYNVRDNFLLHCQAVVTTGIAYSAIIKMSATLHADLIIMGTHGSSGYKNSLIGLNAFNVVKSAACPVLTIPAQKKWEMFKKILFPVRPIPAALEKYDFIRKIISTNNSMLKVLGLSSGDEKEMGLLKDLAAQLNEKLKADEVVAATYFKVGDNMADEVIKIATLMDTDLIVITANMDQSAQQAAVSPYTRHIINHAHYPVLSIKPLTANAVADGITDDNGNYFSTPVNHYN